MFDSNSIVQPRRRRRQLAAVLAAGAGVLPLLLGAGPASAVTASAQPAGRAVSAAEAAMQHVQTVHMQGRVAENGDLVTFNLEVAIGRGLRGRLTVNGRRISLVVVGHTGYAKQRGRRWTSLPDATVADGFVDIPTALLTDLQSASWTFAGRTEVRGVPVLRLTTGTGELDVAARGPAYVVRLLSHGSTVARYYFDHYNAPVSLEPPRT